MNNKDNQTKLIKFIVIMIIVNTFLFIEHRNASAIRLSDAFRYYRMCVQMGCPGGNKKCSEYSPKSGITVTCYQR